MSLASEPQDPLFQALNSSIGFDYRLAPYDLEQSIAAREDARGRGIIGADDAAELERGLEEVRPRSTGTASSSSGRRGHPHGDRAAAHRDGRAGRRQAPHRALAQRPGGHRRGDVRARTRCARRGDRRPDVARWSSWPSATSTGRCPATRTCSAPSRSTSRTTCSPTSGCSARRAALRVLHEAAAELPLGAGALAGVNFDTDAVPSPTLGFDSISPELDRRRLQPRLRARLPVRGRDLRHPPVALGAEIVLWSSEEFGFCEVSTRSPRARASCPRRRTPTRPSCCAPRRRASYLDLVALHGVDARAAAHLQQGPAGGQGAPVRRRRHARAVASQGRRGCSPGIRFDRERLAEAAPTSSWPRPTSPTCWSGAACRSASRTASSRRWCATRSSRASRCPSSRLRARGSPSSTTSTTTCCARALARVEGVRGRHRARRVREQLAAARSVLEAARQLSADPRDPAFYARSVTTWPATWSAACSGTADRRGDRRDRELPPGRAGLPRLRRPDGAHAVLFGPPGSPTSTAPTASTPC